MSMSIAPKRLDVDGLLTDPATSIIVCCGSGGVGKTTAAAALALRAAEQGRKVVVLTIDPARRLAQSLGLTELDNNPREVIGVGGVAGGNSSGGGIDGTADGTGTGTGTGKLYAMMLDMQRTFDEIVEKHADPERVQQILSNPFYQSVSAGFSGTQEYMAMEKLGQLRKIGEETGSWDLIVVDTPPSRSALDFLDAPNRLGSFLDGRFIKILMAPTKAGGGIAMRVLAGGLSIATLAVNKLLGSALLADIQTFVSAFDTMFGSFRNRADETYRLLQADGTAFLVVAAPEPDALREAAYFTERLAAEKMPLAGLVLNRVHRVAAPELSAERALSAAEELEGGGDGEGGYAESGGTEDRRIAAGLLRLHAEQVRLVAREQRLAERFTAAHPAVPVAEIPAQPGDIHDLAGLRLAGVLLAESS